MVTIIDVAKEANVAPSTVSRVIANNPRISEKTKMHVREVMERLDYHPNFQARNLAAKTTKTIGVIMSNSASLAFQNPFFPEVIRGICTSAHASKYGIYLSTGTTSEEIFDEVVSMTQGRQVDGIILLYSKVNDKVMLYLKETGFPFTIVGRPSTYENEITYVDNDNLDISKQVVKHLITLGHKHIAFVGGDLHFVVSNDRLNGYKAALTEAAISFNQDYYIHNQLMQKQGKKAIQMLMACDEPPTAIVAHDDLIAYEMISYLEDLGFQVPRDISIISFNNHSLSQHLKPPLSSVDISIVQLGFEATNCLLEKIHHPETPNKHLIIPTQLIERKSCQRNER